MPSSTTPLLSKMTAALPSTILLLLLLYSTTHHQYNHHYGGGGVAASNLVSITHRSSLGGRRPKNYSSGLNIVKSSSSEDCVGSRCSSIDDDGRNESVQSGVQRGDQEDTSTKKDSNQEVNNNSNFLPPKEEYIKPQYPTLTDYSTGLNIVKSSPSSSSSSTSARRRYDVGYGGDS